MIHAQQPPSAVRLPTLGDGGEMSAGAERRLGDVIARELYRDTDYIDDPQLQEYAEATWQALMAAARARGEISPALAEHFAFTVLLGRDRSVNAFALPGGYMAVNLGLLGVVSTPDELASVLAHELSHISQRHIARLIGREKRMTPLMMGAMVLGILAASKNPEAAQAVAITGQALTIQGQLNFTRDMEREADRVGLGLMAPAGFSPAGFVTMFEKLEQASRINDNGSWPYLRSHPLTTQRIADMQSRQRAQPALGVGAPDGFSAAAHALLAARARVLSQPGVEVLQQWAQRPTGMGFASASPAERAQALYAAALAASELRDTALAQRWLAALQPLAVGDAAAARQVRLLGADIALRAQQPAEALKALSGSENAENTALRPELLLRAQALLALGRAQEVAGDLQTWVLRNPADATAWQTLASHWHQQGQTLRAVRAEGEARAAQYDFAAAVDRFKAGQSLAAQSGAKVDYVEASIIDSRLRQAQSLLKAQTAERLER